MSEGFPFYVPANSLSIDMTHFAKQIYTNYLEECFELAAATLLAAPPRPLEQFMEIITDAHYKKIEVENFAEKNPKIVMSMLREFAGT